VSRITLHDQDYLPNEAGSVLHAMPPDPAQRLISEHDVVAEITNSKLLDHER
jgi:hypothetical protein